MQFCCMEFIINKRTGNKHFLKDFTCKNPEAYAERLVASGHFINEGDIIEVSISDGIEILETERKRLVKEREEFEAEKQKLKEENYIKQRRGRKAKEN